MRYETKAGVTATFTQEGRYNQPSVTLENVPGIYGQHAYHAVQFLNAAALGECFTVSGGWDDQKPHAIASEDVAAIAQMVRANTDRKLGYFQTQWVALDPSVPF